MSKASSPKKEFSASDRLRRRRPPSPQSSRGRSPSPTHLIVIGASAGGQTAVKEVIRGLSDDLPAAIIVMRHMPAPAGNRWGHAYRILAAGRDAHADPSHHTSDPLESGVIYLTPPGMSATVDGQRFQLAPYRKEKAPLTVINALFESAAREYGNRVIGVILTGLLRDGTAGLRAVHEAGGLTIVQSPAEAEYPDMPRNAMADLPVTFCLNQSEIGPALDLLVRRTAGLETGLAISVRMLKQRIALLVRLVHQSTRNDQTLSYLSSELNALKRDLDSIQTVLINAVVH